MTTFITFMPNYYSSLVRSQQQALILDNLYFYAASGTNKTAVANNSPKTIEDEQRVLTDVMYGIKMTPANMSAMIRRVDWTLGKIFAKYDSRDPSLVSKDFYCVTSANDVYKCLDNNRGAPSLEQPNTRVPGPFTLSDGYVWQYMYHIPENLSHTFMVGDYVPLVMEPEVIQAAIRGTISSIDVIDGGEYLNITRGKIQDIIHPTMVRLEDVASVTNNSYDHMGIYIDEGPGEGQLTQITRYTANTSGRYATLAQPLIGAMIGSEYEIAPYINIEGNGLYATARPIMVGNSIDSVQVLSRGVEYTRCDITTSAMASSVITPAKLEANISPIKGHGGDIYQELYVNHVMISVNLDNTDINPIGFPTDDITFSRVGLLRQVIDRDTMTVFSGPSFNNMFTIESTPLFGTYKVGDVIHKEPSVPLPVSGTIVYANNTHIMGTYNSPIMEFDEGAEIISQDGVISTIVSIEQPEVRLLGTDIVAIINTDTIVRKINMSEYLQILIKVK